jgi:NarL family two-component system response regulator LiaR
MSLRVLIVDDHPLMRAGIRNLLENTFQNVDILEAVDGLDALELATQSRPDIVLMDISMPGLNGIEAARRMTSVVPGCRVIMLSMHQDEQRVVESIRAGAAGYVTKDVAVAEVATAIDRVMRGEVFISSSAPNTVTRILASNSTGTSPVSLLTIRQREILQLIAEGRSTKDIGYRLSLSAKTVETHRRLLMERLGIHDVASLARFAVRAGLVSAEL